MLNEYPRHWEPGSGATNFFDVAVLYFRTCTPSYLSVKAVAADPFGDMR